MAAIDWATIIKIIVAIVGSGVGLKASWLFITWIQRRGEVMEKKAGEAEEQVQEIKRAHLAEKIDDVASAVKLIGSDVTDLKVWTRAHDEVHKSLAVQIDAITPRQGVN